MLDNVSNESILSLVCKKNELVQLWKLFSLNIFLIFLVFLIFSLCSDVLEQALMHSSSECTLWPDKRSSQLFPELTPQFARTSCEWVKLCTLKSRSPLKSKKKRAQKWLQLFLKWEDIHSTIYYVCHILWKEGVKAAQPASPCTKQKNMLCIAVT